MSQLLEYLNKYYQPPFNFQELSEKFMNEFGVQVKTDGNLYQFKYHQLEAKFARPLTHECRGSITYWNNKNWVYACRAWNKFFNQHEGFCPIFHEDEFNKLVNSLEFREKVDGTAITLYLNPFTNNWQVSTLGTIIPQNVGDYPFTFSDLFWKTFGLTPTQISTLLDPNYTYIFELACPENRIVTKYPTPQIVLLSVRHNQYGTYINPLDDICIKLLEYGANNLRLPWSKFLYESNITSLNECKLWINSEGKKHIELDGIEYSEGYVLYHCGTPIAKMKNDVYTNLHAVGGGDLKHTRNVVISAYFTGTLDDILPVLHPTMLEFVDKLKIKVNKLKDTISNTEKEFNNKEFKDQKEYALTVQKSVPKLFWSYFFQYKNEIIKSYNPQLFYNWLMLNYGKFEDYWKGE